MKVKLENKELDRNNLNINYNEVSLNILSLLLVVPSLILLIRHAFRSNIGEAICTLFWCIPFLALAFINIILILNCYVSRCGFEVNEGEV